MTAIFVASAAPAEAISVSAPPTASAAAFKDFAKTKPPVMLYGGRVASRLQSANYGPRRDLLHARSFPDRNRRRHDVGEGGAARRGGKPPRALVGAGRDRAAGTGSRRAESSGLGQCNARGSRSSHGRRQ